VKAWIVGKNGMLGRAFAEVLGRDSISTGRELDVFSDQGVARFIVQEKPTHLFNCAAYTNVDKAEEEATLAALSNVELPKRLAEIAKEYGLSMTHFSTDYVFDGGKNTPYEEEDATAPLNVYGETKREGEKRVLGILPSACIIRTSWLYGEYGTPFPWKVVDKLKKGVTLHMVDDQVGAPTYTGDLVNVALQLVGHPGIFHVANRGTTTWYGITVFIAEWLKKRGVIEAFEVHPTTSDAFQSLATRPKYSVFCLDRVESILSGELREWDVALMEYLERINDRLET
jgi:dTDP-4-dehydrorhamnose reductase